MPGLYKKICFSYLVRSDFSIKHYYKKSNMNLKKRRHGPHHALICNKFDASSFQRRLACNQFVYMDLVQKKACKKTIDQPYQIFCDAFISFFLSFFLFSLSKDIRNLVDFQSYLDDNRKPRISASSNLSASIGEKKTKTQQ